MIVYYVEWDSAVRSRVYARTRAEAHRIAKTAPALNPAVVRAGIASHQSALVAILNGDGADQLTPLAAWTLSPRLGLRPLALTELP